LTPRKRYHDDEHEHHGGCCGGRDEDCCDADDSDESGCDDPGHSHEGCCGGPHDACDEGGPPPGAQMRELEVLQRAIGRLLAEKQFDSAEEANAFVSSLIADKSAEEIFAGLDLTPEEESLLLVAQAIKANNDEEALELLERALELDPTNLDAQIALINAESPEDEAAQLRKIVRDAENRLGEAFFASHRGDFYTDPVTRPYMRARQMLMTALGQTGDIEGAIAEAEGLLDLCPNDNLGVREFLAGYYLTSDRAEDALTLMDGRYPKDHSAVFEYARMLANYKVGREDAAKESLTNALERNPYVLPLLFGLMRPEEVADTSAPGTPGEAMFVIGVLYDALVANQSALEWAVGKWQEIME